MLREATAFGGLMRRENGYKSGSRKRRTPFPSLSDAPNPLIELPFANGLKTASSLPEAVQKVLDGCDQTSPIGRRNYAILLLLARLGLRAGEVVALQLEDIDWENAQITIRSKKGRGWARMPLPTEVGKAL